MKTFTGTFLEAKAAYPNAAWIVRVSDTEWTIYEAGDPLPPTPPAPPPMVWPQSVTVTNGMTVNMQVDPNVNIGMLVLQGAGPIASLTVAWPPYASSIPDQLRNVKSEIAIASVTHTVQGGGVAPTGMATEFQRGDDNVGQLVVVDGVWTWQRWGKNI